MNIVENNGEFGEVHGNPLEELKLSVIIYHSGRQSN